MKKRRTHQEFVEELNLILPNIEVLSPFVSVNKKMHFKCTIHDYEFDAWAQNMLRGHGCKKCGLIKYSAARSKPHEQFVLDFKKINPNIEIIGTYVNMNTRVRVKCIIDGYTWDALPRSLVRGDQCGVCVNRVVAKGINDVATTRPDLLKYFKNIEDAYKYTAGSDTKVDIICPECGHEDNVCINHLSRSEFSCKGCYEKKHGRKRVPYGYWNEDTIKQYVNENYLGYRALDTAKVDSNSRSRWKVLLKCPNEKHEPYWVDLTNILGGYTCRRCYEEDSMSNGERMAESVFINNNIKYISQKRFEDCRDTLTLPFDFYLPDYNLVVEIMGKQHECPVDFFGGQEGFEKLVRHDKIKRDYLQSNNINCLDIWYYEFNSMESIILCKIQKILTLNNTKLMCDI